MTDSSSAEKLRNCPWCGSSDIKLFSGRTFDLSVVHYAQCLNCTSCGPDHKNGRHWNEFHPICNEQLQGLVDRLSWPQPIRDDLDLAATAIERLTARVAELEADRTAFKLPADKYDAFVAALDRPTDEPNDSAAEPIDAETIIHNFEHSVRADERNSDKYTKEYVAESRDELKVALSTTQPPQAAEPDEAIASLAAMCGWAELLAELGGWTRANAASFWYAYDAARKLAPTKISPVISPPPVAEHTPQPPNDELVAAARAVVARWETPAWKVAPATAGYIYALRDALDRYAHQAPAAARNHVAWLIESIDNGKAYWWRGSDFTDDANEAVRFSRREDADQVILERGMDDSFSAEHMWCDVPSPTKESGL